MLTLCDVCGKSETAERPILSCSKCKKAFYCSKACQTADWKSGHRRKCQESQEELAKGDGAELPFNRDQTMLQLERWCEYYESRLSLAGIAAAGLDKPINRTRPVTKYAHVQLIRRSDITLPYDFSPNAPSHSMVAHIFTVTDVATITHADILAKAVNQDGVQIHDELQTQIRNKDLRVMGLLVSCDDAHYFFGYPVDNNTVAMIPKGRNWLQVLKKTVNARDYAGDPSQRDD